MKQAGLPALTPLARTPPALNCARCRSLPAEHGVGPARSRHFPVRRGPRLPYTTECSHSHSSAAATATAAAAAAATGTACVSPWHTGVEYNEQQRHVCQWCWRASIAHPCPPPWSSSGQQRIPASAGATRDVICVHANPWRHKPEPHVWCRC